MFTKDTSTSEAETIISSSVKVEGDLTSGGDIIIDGRVEGTVATIRNLMIGEKAEITADIKAANARVAGQIKGNLDISERLELTPTSHITGNVIAKILVVAEGAQLNGHCQMADTDKATETAKEREVTNAATSTRVGKKASIA